MVTEKEIKDILKKEICLEFPNEYDKIWINRSLSRSDRLKLLWKKQWNQKVAPSLQPDIDILYLHRDGRIMATELKYFRESNNQINYSYYVGLSQALALLPFGFDHVSLMYVFDKELLKKGGEKRILQEYGGNAWRFIRHNIDKKPRKTTIKNHKKVRKPGIGLDFTCVIFDKTKKGKDRFQVAGINPRSDRLPVRKYVIGNLRPLIEWKYKNPLEGKDVANKFRKFICEEILA